MEPFIDNSNPSLKCVHLHNGNKCVSMTGCNSTSTKLYNYTTNKQKIKYDENKWVDSKFYIQYIPVFYVFEIVKERLSTGITKLTFKKWHDSNKEKLDKRNL